LVLLFILIFLLILFIVLIFLFILLLPLWAACPSLVADAFASTLGYNKPASPLSLHPGSLRAEKE
jgi:hypothetical protein